MVKINRTLLLSIFIGLLYSCSSNKNPKENIESEGAKEYLGSVERLSGELNDIIPEGAKIEVLAKEFLWAEGPVWIPEIESIVFSDVPANTIYKWNEIDGLTTFLEPSGNTGYAPSSHGEGSNGLTTDRNGQLILCQHADRRVSRFKGDFENPSPEFETIVDQFGGNRFNSPNDLTIASSGEIYFTDPPYGLLGQDQDSLKEMSFNGVYKLSTDGTISLLDSTLLRPNGIALAPDEKTLYVANSNPENAIWMAYDVTEEGIENGRIFFDATESVPELPGLPDGIKVNKQGIIFATGPGGVLVFKPDGTHLGTVMTELASANCALGPDEKSLFMTTHKYLTRIALK